MKNAIVITNLIKKYYISSDETSPPYSTIRDNLTNFIKNNRSFGNKVQLIALNNINLTVKKGDRIGIIGYNGAGKSTLLKIISQITRPSSGRVVIDGRVGSLLEVGTGFHPELTARENIYLNGAILGMSKNEIIDKLPEIIHFADIGNFLNTPVKYFSSGLYMRLAFSVAAHLETDILLVDEVLAVGDLAFQNKCIGKISEINRQGRTILFVSHNLTTIRQLCDKAILIDKGVIVKQGDVNLVIDKYLSMSSGLVGCVWQNHDTNELDSDVYIKSVRLVNNNLRTNGIFLNTDEITIEFCVLAKKLFTDLKVGFDLYYQGGLAFRSQQVDAYPKPVNLVIGDNILHCTLPANLLNKGSYFIAPILARHAIKTYRAPQPPVLSFTVDINPAVNPFHGLITNISQPGPVFPQLRWVLV